MPNPGPGELFVPTTHGTFLILNPNKPIKEESDLENEVQVLWICMRRHQQQLEKDYDPRVRLDREGWIEQLSTEFTERGKQLYRRRWARGEHSTLQLFICY